MLFIHGSNIKMGYRNDVDLIIRVNHKTINEWILELLIQPGKQDLYYTISEYFDSERRIKNTPTNILHLYWDQVKWYGNEQEDMETLIDRLSDENVDAYMAKIGDDDGDVVTNFCNEGYKLGHVSRSFVPSYKE